MTPRARPMLIGAALCAVAFLFLLAMVYSDPAGRWIDAAALQGLVSLQSPGLDWIVTAIAHLGDALPLLLLTVALVSCALVLRRPREAAAALAVISAANVTTQILKPLLAFTRDGVEVASVFIGAAAFPSGHATASMSFAIAAIIVTSAGLRPIAAACGAVFALAVSLSLVILGWHYPSDVVGGYLVATGWGFLALAALREADARWPERTGREAARRALAENARARSVLAGVGLATIGLAALAGVVALIKLPALLAYAAAHTTAAIVAPAVVLSAAALLVSFAAISSRR